jgi:hypothetical protein
MLAQISPVLAGTIEVNFLRRRKQVLFGAGHDLVAAGGLGEWKLRLLLVISSFPAPPFEALLQIFQVNSAPFPKLLVGISGRAKS